MFLNISGVNFIPNNLSPNCIKVFVDTNPGYNQVLLKEKFAWSEFVERWCEKVSEHDVHFTYGENINEVDCLVPKLGWTWLPTRMPIVIDEWQVASAVDKMFQDSWTTIMSWNVLKGAVVYQGVEYGDKSREFRKILELPGRTGLDLKLALGGGKVPYKDLQAIHWHLLNAPEVTTTADTYKSFIWNSRGKISIAKHIYVAMKTGWFSDRSACCLASGRPVILQDTGFSKLLPTGEGLFAFTTLEEAVEAMQAVEKEGLDCGFRCCHKILVPD